MANYNKVILIGTQSKEDANDYAQTPYSKQNFINSKLVVHANIIETLVHDNAISIASKWVNVLLTFILITLVVAIVFKSSPITGVFYTVLFGVSLVFFAVVTFRFGRIWVDLSHPLLGSFFAYYFLLFRIYLRRLRAFQRR